MLGKFSERITQASFGLQLIANGPETVQRESGHLGSEVAGQTSKCNRAYPVNASSRNCGETTA
jgi:hypothetical protein